MLQQPGHLLLGRSTAKPHPNPADDADEDLVAQPGVLPEAQPDGALHPHRQLHALLQQPEQALRGTSRYICVCMWRAGVIMGRCICSRVQSTPWQCECFAVSVHLLVATLFHPADDQGIAGVCTPYLREGAVAFDVECDLLRVAALATGATPGASEGVPLCRVVKLSL